MANAAEAFRIKGELYGVVDDTARETASAATVLEEFDRQKSIGQYPGRSLADAFAAEIAAKGDIYAWQGALAAYLAGLPLDLVHSVATVIFLSALYLPWKRKLERIKRKYALR